MKCRSFGAISTNICAELAAPPNASVLRMWLRGAALRPRRIMLTFAFELTTPNDAWSSVEGIHRLDVARLFWLAPERAEPKAE